MKSIPSNSVDCVFTSPPYYQHRVYGKVDVQIGQEQTRAEFIAKLKPVFEEIYRILKKDGVCFVNIADTYMGGGRGGNPEHSKHQKQKTNKGSVGVKDAKVPRQAGIKNGSMMQIPAHFTIAMEEIGWILRQEVIWHKTNPMPESTTSRPSTAHEPVFMFTKTMKYHYLPQFEPTVDNKGIRNSRSVFQCPVSSAKTGHNATFSTELVEHFLKAIYRPGNVVLDPFSGSGSTGVAALKMGMSYIGLDCNQEYVEASSKRLQDVLNKVFLN